MLSLEAATAWLTDYAQLVSEHSSELTELDRQIGDADHGSNLERGMAAVVAVCHDEQVDAAALFKAAGMALVSTVGGAAGPLFGTFFLRFGAALSDSGTESQQVATALRAGLDGVMQRGKAAARDKTMVDALIPAVEAAERKAAAGASVAELLTAAAEAADAGREATVDMVARKGRASYLGERSAGTADPGATSVAWLLASAARTLSPQRRES